MAEPGVALYATVTAALTTPACEASFLTSGSDRSAGVQDRALAKLIDGRRIQAHARFKVLKVGLLLLEFLRH